MILHHFDPFVIPFTIGVVWLFSVVIYKYVRWFFSLPASDRKAFFKALFTFRSFKAVREVIEESLLHKSIFKTNPLLGYMHTSLALGWFLLIVVGKLETSAYLKDPVNLPHVHVFFRYFFPEEPFRFHRNFNYAFIMDALLILVLSGVALAMIKRFYGRVMMGMRKRTQHTAGDRVALAALWVVFPARLLAESTTCGIHNTGSFFTSSTGAGLLSVFGTEGLQLMELPVWWLYSLALGVFFITMPYSRYMHIFTEIPHIFLRNCGIKPKEEESEADNFQIQACSRCGICIDPCQLQASAGINGVQSVYFLRDRRYGYLTTELAENCLMCGRCEAKCPVHIDLNALRLNSRKSLAPAPGNNRYSYIKGTDRSEGSGKTGYFAGCMTLLSAPIMSSMKKIFDAAGEDVWWADKDGGVCCGRPMKLSGEVDAARAMIHYNKELFVKHGITTLVTSCPICLKVFREDYALEGIEVLHHSQYILRLLHEKRIKVDKSAEILTYHDPCELGRGLGIYADPREVIGSVASLREAAEHGKNAPCCGGSLANFSLDSAQEDAIAGDAARVYARTGASRIVSACPQCKSSLKKNSSIPVLDLAEVVAARVVS